MKRSKKPCVGCGKDPKVSGTWVGALCYECARAIKQFRDAEALEKMLNASGHGAFQVPVPGRPQDLPYMPHEDRDAPFRKVFLELVHAVSRPAEKSHGRNLFKVSFAYARGQDRLFAVDTAKCLEDLYEAAIRLVEHGYEEGRRDGASLLKRMMAGEITNAEINTLCAGNRS